MQKFHVVYTPDDDGVRWNARVKGKVNGTGCGTWGRSLSGARANLREALAVALEDDQAAESAELIEEFDLPQAGQLKVLRAKRAQVERDVEYVAKDTAKFARQLKAKGYSLRDIAELVGTSFQRVQQFVAAKG